ncbi:MAG TPA: acetyl-CoA carboxylase biotin carboxyl carrier protein subunit [Bacteroidales bacterium]|nr:acetyl-CoA carboxylase biotin carboxyl carrier protein subunit [Bacteroidales bacterium]
MKKKENKLEKLNINYSEYTTRLSSKFKERVSYKPVDKTRLMSFIPGTIIEILIAEGDKVCKGDEILVLEAMKMKNRIKSPVEGLVKSINVELNEKVPKGKVLIEIDLEA